MRDLVQMDVNDFMDACIAVGTPCGCWFLRADPHPTAGNRIVKVASSAKARAVHAPQSTLLSTPLSNTSLYPGITPETASAAIGEPEGLVRPLVRPLPECLLCPETCVTSATPPTRHAPSLTISFALSTAR